MGTVTIIAILYDSECGERTCRQVAKAPRKPETRVVASRHLVRCACLPPGRALEMVECPFSRRHPYSVTIAVLSRGVNAPLGARWSTVLEQVDGRPPRSPVPLFPSPDGFWRCHGNARSDRWPQPNVLNRRFTQIIANRLRRFAPRPHPPL